MSKVRRTVVGAVRRYEAGAWRLTVLGEQWALTSNVGSVLDLPDLAALFRAAEADHHRVPSSAEYLDPSARLADLEADGEDG